MAVVPVGQGTQRSKTQPQAVKIKGLRGGVQGGYLIGRLTPGSGDAQLIAIGDLREKMGVPTRTDLAQVNAKITVTSVFGRTGVIVAVAGDYAASQVTNDSSVVGATVKDALNTLRTSGGSMLPLVNGDKPGPVLLSAPDGQTIGVAL